MTRNKVQVSQVLSTANYRGTDFSYVGDSHLRENLVQLLPKISAVALGKQGFVRRLQSKPLPQPPIGKELIDIKNGLGTSLSLNATIISSENALEVALAARTGAFLALPVVELQVKLG